MSSLKPAHKGPLAVIASKDADYERLNLARDAVAMCEDGARTDNRRGTYEWWYFDAHLNDGSSLVVVFMYKDLATPTDPLTPTIRIDLDLADGRSYQKLVTYAPDSWQASTSTADVRIGENRFSGDLHTYRIQATVDEITVDVTLVGQVRAWRPQTGYLLYGAGRDKEFAWLPSVPQGAVTATYRIGSEVHETTGVGYHDHNWGNVSLAKIVHDWYWARGQAGPYSVIASLVTAHEQFGYAELPIFMLARDGEVVADDSGRVRFEALTATRTHRRGSRSRQPPATPTPVRKTSAGSSRSHAIGSRKVPHDRSHSRPQAGTRAAREIRRCLPSLRGDARHRAVPGYGAARQAQQRGDLGADVRRARTIVSLGSCPEPTCRPSAQRWSSGTRGASMSASATVSMSSRS
jgi:hypothetical protein